MNLELKVESSTSPSPLFIRTSDLKASISLISQQAFHQFRKVWNYAGKSLLLTRHVLNVVVKHCRFIKLNNKTANQIISSTIPYLKLFSILSIPLSTLDLITQIKKIWNQAHIQDRIGIVLTSISIVVITTDAFDTLTTFVNALLQTLSHQTLGWISTIGAPLAFTLLGLSSINRVVKLIQIAQFKREFTNYVLKPLGQKKLEISELQAVISHYLTLKKIDLKDLDQILKTEIDLQKKDLLRAQLERESNAEIFSSLIALSEKVTSTSKLTEFDLNFMDQHIKKIQSAMNHEIFIQTSFLLVNLVSAVAVALFSWPVIAILPFILLAISVLMRLALQIYQDKRVA